MRNVFVVSDNIYSPIGATTNENLSNLARSVSGVKQQSNQAMSARPFYAALFDDNAIATGSYFTRFEQMLATSIADGLKGSGVEPSDKRTILIISSTKGNIGLLETEAYNSETKNRIALYTSAKLIARHFNFVHTPIIVSNACISGILSVLMGLRLIQSGMYDHAVIAGADTVSKFVLSGFQSFQAVSSELCRPFDAARNGINLGEGAATMVLSVQKHEDAGIKIGGGAVSNDANHISGPSRTGEELCMAINKATKQAGLSKGDIDLISAHGTATIYNDEMEARAINLAGMQHAPVNSLKGFYGHTLGAAGLIESVVAIHSLKEGVVFPTLGFVNMGVSMPLAISNELQHGTFTNALKTASGFGGCNAALVICKQ